jgi:hypothetical protein
MPDGCYYEAGELHHRGPADRFVRTLVRSASTGSASPELASEAIVLARQEAAFPSHASWARCSSWPYAPTASSAEEAVKRSGIGLYGRDGTIRHWCDGLWVQGDEKDCVHPGHRTEPESGRIQRLIQLALPMPAPMPARRGEASIPEDA